MGIGQAITFPPFFASKVLYHVQIMPPILQWFSLVNLMSYIVDAVRSLMISGNLTNPPHSIWQQAQFSTR